MEAGQSAGDKSMNEAMSELLSKVAHQSQIADLRLVTAEDGPERGCRFIQARLASGLGMEIAVDRGFDISTVTDRGVMVGWYGPAGLPASALNHPELDRGLGLMRHFSGFLVTCGWDHHGPPQRGAADHFGYVHRKEIGYPMHGRAAFLPARLLSYAIEWENRGGPLFVAEAELRQASMFGERLLVRRRIEAPVFEARFRVTDIVRNEGVGAVPHAVLYHINFGWPLVDDGTRVEGFANTERMPPKVETLTQHGQERVCFVPRGALTGTPAIVSPSGRRVVVTPETDTLTQVGQWRCRFERMNVIAIEPATSISPPESTRDGWISPGESITHAFSIEISGG